MSIWLIHFQTPFKYFSSKNQAWKKCQNQGNSKLLSTRGLDNFLGHFLKGNTTYLECFVKCRLVPILALELE